MSSVATINPFDLLFVEEPEEIIAPVVTPQIKKVVLKTVSKTKALEPSVHDDSKDTRGSSARGASAKPSIRGKRDHDRHQKTGRTDSEKKNVAGKGTWGAAGSEETETENTTVTPQEPVEPTEEEIQAQLEREIEEKQMSLADYLAMKKKSTLPVAITQARAANKGADQAQWKTQAAVEKVDVDFIVIQKTVVVSEGKVVQKAAKAQAERVVIDVQPPRFQSEGSGRGSSDRGRGGRGGRGGVERSQGDRSERSERPQSDRPDFERSERGRGGRGRGGSDRSTFVPRGARGPSKATPVNVNDTSAFPALG